MPLRNSCEFTPFSFTPFDESHIRIRVPLSEVVAMYLPEGDTLIVVSAEVCAWMYETASLFTGKGGTRTPW